jgi:RNA recognition motif-containing protein
MGHSENILSTVYIPSEPALSNLKKEKSSKKRKVTETESDIKSKPKKEKASTMVQVEVEAGATEPTMASAVSLESKTPESKPKKEKKERSSKRKSTDTSPPTAETIENGDGMIEIISEPDTAERPSKKRKTIDEEIEVDITAPEPPSKKALRALKKGKPLPPSKSGADTKPEPAAKKPEQEKRSEHGVWIGNLPWSVSKDDLRKFLVEYSDITEDTITRVHMPGPDDNKSANKVVPPKFGKIQHNKGFAYVDFSTAKGVELAIELSEQLLSGRRVLIKDNKSYEGRPEKTKVEIRNEGKPPNKKIFLGNLSFDTNEETLKERFEKCGAIESVKVATFEDTGKCKGYAWIVFEELESAQHAVRGFVNIKEEISDDESESEGEAASDEEERKPKLKKTKMRKFWINQIKGRPLKVEYAEDAQVRYKKRYGKEGTKRVGTEDALGEDVKENRRPVKATAQPIAYDLPYGGPRLTGGIVEATGKKTLLS